MAAICMKVAHLSQPEVPGDDGRAFCPICNGERLSFKPADEEDSLDALMADQPKPYILWIYTPSEGYSRNDCDSLEDCYKTALGMCASDFTITGPPINVGFIELSEGT